MSALQDWYSYVDGLLRPSRRLEEVEEWWVPDDEAGEPEDEGGETAAREPRRSHPDRAPGPPRPAGNGRGAERLPVPPTPLRVDARAIVARLARRASAPAPPVQWETVPGECPVPNLEEFIPHLSAGRAPGTAARTFLETVARHFPVSPPPPPALPDRGKTAAPPQGEEPQDAPAPPPPRSPRKATAAVQAPASTLASPPAAAAPPLPSPPARTTAVPPPAGGERRDLPTIGAIREGLPRTMERLLQIPITEEVAQNSYKSPFRETREELIERLFDPPLTLEETARLLGVCPTTVRRYTNKGLLDHYRTQGNQRRFRLSDLLAFLERYGDTGPDAGSLGGAAGSWKSRARGKHARPAADTGGRTDAEHVEPDLASSDALRADAP